MKKKVIIIDDEKLSRDVIKNYLEKHSDYEIMQECSNAFEGIRAINQLKPDLIFLDIQMPKITGFEMLELIEHRPQVIFSTAFDNYAIKAFEVNAVDYLLKPFSEARFNDALKKIEGKIFDSGESPDIEKMKRHFDNSDDFLHRIVIKKNNDIIIIPVDNINLIEAQDDYVQIYTQQGTYLNSRTMKYFETHLDPSEFIRVHRSFIIKILQIKRIEPFEKGSYRIITMDNIPIPVSKSGFAKLKEILD